MDLPVNRAPAVSVLGPFVRAPLFGPASAVGTGHNDALREHRRLVLHVGEGCTNWLLTPFPRDRKNFLLQPFQHHRLSLPLLPSLRRSERRFFCEPYCPMY